MRIAVLALLVVALLAPAGAHAGTYDVVSCNAPGANGRNNSLTYAASSWDPQYAGQVGGWYEADTSCADGLVARSRTVDGTVAKWLTGGAWTFAAPPGTEIVAFSHWRFAEARDSGGDDPNTPLIDEGDHWRAEVADHTGQPIGGAGGGETCAHGPNVPACTFGVLGGERRDHRVLTSQLRWHVSCVGEITGGCPTSYGGYPLASMVVYGTRVTLQDNSAPTAALSGPLVTPGWRRPTDAVSYSASDNSGIRTATLSAGTATASDPRSCDFTYRVPCGNASNRPLQFASRLPDGQYPIRLTVTDAAGNPRTVDAPVAIDGTAPTAGLRPPRRRILRVAARDHASGFAGGQIGVRNGASEPYRALPTTYRRGMLRARLDRGRPSRTDVRVHVRDNAGNEANGSPTRLLLTSVRAGERRLPVRRGTVRGRFGRTITFRGKLRNPRGRPVGGVPVTIASRPSSRSPSAQEAATTTSPTGRFVLRVPPGTTRRIVLGFPGSGESLAARKSLRLAVPASSTIRASRRRLGGSGVVRFSGRVRRGGSGLIVVLQGYEQGRWRTFADTRTGKRGRWRARYRFSGRPGSYPVRARIRPQRGFPYATGYSRPVVIRVG